MKKRYLFALALVLLLIPAGLYVRQQIDAANAAPVPKRTARVQRQAIEFTVSASGSLAPAGQVEARFGTAGPIAAVDVRLGDAVVAGQRLAALDTADLDLALSDARNQLELSRLRLAQLAEPASADDIAVAEASVAAAKAGLAELLKPADPHAIEIARLNVERAKIQLWQAQLGSPDPAFGPLIPQYQYDLGRLRTESGELSVEQAETKYRQATQGATRDQINAARAQIDQAAANLARLKTGPRAEDLAVAQAQVDAAQLAVDAAQSRLARAVLTAPSAGVVVGVSVHAGEMASPALPAFVIVDAARYHIDLAVDEIDVARLVAGQPVTVTLDALGGRAFTGRVGDIATLASQSNGVVAYTVRVDLNNGDPQLRAGMTANAVIVTERRANVLVVPNWAVRVDRGSGQAFVPVERNGTVREVPIRLGLRNETVSEVLEGVAEGEEIVLVEARPSFSFFGGR